MEEARSQEQEAVIRLSAELRELFLRVFGKEPDHEIIRKEAESIVAKYGVTAEIRDILNV